MLVKFLQVTYCPGYHGPGEVVEMDDLRALALMKEHPAALERYVIPEPKRAELPLDDTRAPLTAPRPSVQPQAPRMASQLRKS